MNTAMRENTIINAKKVLIMGLDNSGKTSIVLCLRGVKNLSSFSSLNPTRGFKINKFQTLGSEYSIWDFGGQEQFREGYLNDFQTHIKKTNKFIYVLDVQDQERFDKSLDYLEKIVILLKKHNVNIDFSIFLHKYDPDLEFTNKEFSAKVVSDLIRNIKELIPNDFMYKIYKTSIYTVFQKFGI
jgi:small GTP-binding protein